MWTDRDGNPVEVPEPPPGGSYYGPIGDFQGASYERNAFAAGTDQEAAFLWERLRLTEHSTVVDVGCGPGRHARALAGRGARVLGVDLSFGLLAAGAARAGAARVGFVQGDAARLPVATGAADVVLCLCQGGFGIAPGADRRILAHLARVLRPGGRLALTAFSLPFAARWLAPDEAIDVARGVVWSRADVRGADGEQRTWDLWTTCYSAPHLRAMAEAAGLRVDGISGVEPGRYGDEEPGLLHPELLLVATRP